MVSNPFKYGEFATGAAFCNRTAEIKRIKQAFHDGQNIILISPRRWGKSSLVDEALNHIDKKILVAKVDCFAYRSAEEFYSALLREYLKAASTKMHEIMQTAKKFLGAIVPYISYSTGANEEIKVSLSLPSEKLEPSHILELPQKIAKEKGIKMVVCIDEFQKITEWPESDSMLEKLRSIWQKHKDVCYCLYGSKRSIMTTLFSDSSQPFYRFGETIFLEKISRQEWIDFIVKQFLKTEKKVNAELAAMLVDYAQCHSYYVQYLARYCWNLTEKTASEEIVKQAYQGFLNDHLNIFDKMTYKLTQYQVNYLKAFCNGEKKFTSARVLTTYNLGSPGNIKRIEQALEDLEILDFAGQEPFFNDPFFEPLFRKIFME